MPCYCRHQGERKSFQYVELPIPHAKPNEVFIKILACAICRTDLHVVDGDLKQPRLPVIPGHQIVGIIEKLGSDVKGFRDWTAYRHSKRQKELQPLFLLCIWQGKSL